MELIREETAPGYENSSAASIGQETVTQIHQQSSQHLRREKALRVNQFARTEVNEQCLARELQDWRTTPCAAQPAHGERTQEVMHASPMLTKPVSLAQLSTRSESGAKPTERKNRQKTYLPKTQERFQNARNHKKPKRANAQPNARIDH